MKEGLNVKNNFVSIVGYQFERVHTGVISWLLNTKNSTVPLDIKYEIICRIHQICKQPVNFQIHEIKAITCIPEYSFGRKRKIDLVVKIDLFDRNPKYLVIEMKVDSIPNSDQLQGTQFDFIQQNACDPNDVLFLLFLLGSSQVCTLPNLHGFIVFRLPYILEVFAGLHIDGNIYEDWIESLRNEDVRRACIVSEIKNAPQIWDKDYWREKGYRTWFPLFYYMYHELKQHSIRSNEWEIYSVQNNPVMNWGNGWLKRNILGCNVVFYWEFNYEEFLLKVLLDENHKLSQEDLNWLRDEIAALCDNETLQNGRKTQNRYGIYNSLYKWNFDFKNQDFVLIMKDVDAILNKIHPKLIQSF